MPVITSNRDALIQSMLKEGNTHQEIADVIGITRRGVGLLCQRRGWDSDRVALLRQNATLEREMLTATQLEQIKSMIVSGSTYQQVADTIGSDVRTIGYQCKKNGWKSKFTQRQERNAVLLSQGRKECATCHIEREIDDFDLDPRAIGERSSQCKECRRPRMRASMAKRYADPLQKPLLQERSRQWKAANPAKVQAYSAQYWQDHKEQCKANLRSWYERHPYMHQVYAQQREQRMKGAPGYFTEEQLVARVELYNDQCYLCGGPNEAIDHVKPLVKGGSNWPANLRPICGVCNSHKWGHWPYDFAAHQDWLDR